MIRVTTNGTLYNYKSHLMNSSKKLNDSFESVLTQRQFNTFAEDPAAATQAFRLRSARNTAGQQLYNNKAVIGKFSTGWSIIEGVKNDIANDMGKIPALEGSSDTNLSVLKELGQVLKAGAEAIVQDMNGKYGDNFIFGGAETLEVPFAWGDVTKTVETTTRQYVDGNGDPVLDTDGNPFTRTETLVTYSWGNGKTHQVTSAQGDPPQGATEATGKAVYTKEETSSTELLYRDTPVDLVDQATYDKLNDKLNVDIGLGFKEANGSLIDSSAYDSALNGLDFLGYGTENGLPQNIVSVMLELGEAFQSYDLETNTWNNPGGRERAQELVSQLERSSEAMGEAFTELDANTSYLNTNYSRLEETADNLNEQITALEDIDPAQAIMELSWAQQCYNAALKAGTSIISQSLFDYMN